MFNTIIAIIIAAGGLLGCFLLTVAFVANKADAKRPSYLLPTIFSLVMLGVSLVRAGLEKFELWQLKAFPLWSTYIIMFVACIGFLVFGSLYAPWYKNGETSIGGNRS